MILLNHVLVATDFGEASDAALSYGRALARTFGAKLHLLHVTENVYLKAVGTDTYSVVFPELQRDVDEEARRQLRNRLDQDTPTDIALLTSNAPAASIVDYAKAHQIDLIVVGTHGRGAVAHLLMGSVAEKVVRSAPCPVLTVRQPEREFVVPDALAVLAKV
jgi:nucleotide-binding universal stress UspA family protein